MALTTDPVFPIPAPYVEPWPDPVIDELGHDPRSAYVERFWLPVLGPSTVLVPAPPGRPARPPARRLRPRSGRHRPQPRRRHEGRAQLPDAARRSQRSCRFGAARMHGTTSDRRAAPPGAAHPGPGRAAPRCAPARAHRVADRPAHLPHRRADEGPGPLARPLAARARRGHRHRRAPAPPVAVPPRRRPRGGAVGRRRRTPASAPPAWPVVPATPSPSPVRRGRRSSDRAGRRSARSACHGPGRRGTGARRRRVRPGLGGGGALGPGEGAGQLEEQRARRSRCRPWRARRRRPRLHAGAGDVEVGPRDALADELLEEQRRR